MFSSAYLSSPLNFFFLSQNISFIYFNTSHQSSDPFSPSRFDSIRFDQRRITVKMCNFKQTTYACGCVYLSRTFECHHAKNLENKKNNRAADVEEVIPHRTFPCPHTQATFNKNNNNNNTTNGSPADAWEVIEMDDYDEDMEMEMEMFCPAGYVASKLTKEFETGKVCERCVRREKERERTKN